MNNLKRIAISDDGFLFDPLTGDSYVCNGTGLAILRLLKQGLDAAAIAEALVLSFDTDMERAQRDVLDFLDCLRPWGLA